MDIHVSNVSALDMKQMAPLLKSFLPFAQEKLGFSKPVSVNFTSDAENAEKPLGKTGFYDPDGHSITIFVDKRHPKDIMRSLSHELVHHTQNCDGKFSDLGSTGAGYAQKDPHLRGMEREAYEKGNLTFRDWEDQNKKYLQEAVFWGKNTLITEEKGPILLTEGGGPGHMAHPFDLDYVKTGQDLLNFFTEKVPEYLSKYDAHIKTDGINVSFKLVSKTNFYGEEEREFAVDRGSMYAIDREGITLDRIGERWKPGHGMIPAITDLLTILNAALDSGAIDEEVKALGLVDNPDYYINTEYVKETEEKPVMNVIKYGEDFIAFHGINEFKFVESKKTKSVSRDGKNVVPTTKSSAAALESFTRKVKGFTRDYGVFGKEDTKVGQRKGSSIDFNSVLSEKVSICCSKDGKVMTDTLGGWLSNPKTINPFGPPDGAKIVLANGKPAFAMSKQVYLSLIAGVDTISTSDLLGGMDEGKQQMAIDAVNGAIFNHATRGLGRAVLETLYASFGGHTAAQHEGVVLWDKKGNKEIFNFPYPIKITGDFIVEGMGGAISQKMAKEEPAVEAGIKRKIAVFPGAFKPPHRGHMDVVEHFASVADQVVVLISPLSRKTPAGKEINKSVSEKIWQIYIDAKGIGNKVSIGSSPYNSPVQASFEVLKGNVPDFVPQAGDLIIPVASDKPDKRGKPDYERFMKFHEGLPDMVPGVIPANIEEFFYKAPSEGALSASAFRAALDTGEGIEAFLPTAVSAQEVFEALGVELEPEPEVEEPDGPEEPPLPFFMGESLDAEIDRLLDEVSTMGGGNVEGAPAMNGGPFPGLDVEKENRKEKERSGIKDREPIVGEVLNYLLGKMEIL